MMQYKCHRDDVPKEEVVITIIIGSNRYRLTEGFEGSLNINKYSDDDHNILIKPKTGNNIEII